MNYEQQLTEKDLILKTKGKEVLRISAMCDKRIGTKTPSTKLEVQSELEEMK